MFESLQDQVRQSLCFLSCKKDDLILTNAYPAGVQAIAYDKTITGSHHEAVQDGEDFMLTKQDGTQVRTMGGLKMAYGVVLGFDGKGLHVKKNGGGVCVFAEDLDFGP